MQESDKKFLERIKKQKDISKEETIRLKKISENTLNELYKNTSKGKHKSIAMFNQSMHSLFKQEECKGPDINDIKVGDMYYANLLLEYDNEIAYIHPVLVLGKFKSNLLVVPGTSSELHWKTAYHKSSNPKENMKKKYRVYNYESGADKNGTFFLNSFRSIHKNKIVINEKLGQLHPDTDSFKDIYDYIFGKAFKSEKRKLENFIKKENENKN